MCVAVEEHICLSIWKYECGLSISNHNLSVYLSVYLSIELSSELSFYLFNRI